MKNLFTEFCDFCDQGNYKILKFHSAYWLGTTTCIERVVELFSIPAEPVSVIEKLWKG